jgi:small subunit ribosomal protein S6
MATHYETVIIFSPMMPDEEVKRAVARYTKMVTDAGATILEERLWGLRQLAYEIKGKSNGIYYIFEYVDDQHVIDKIETEFRRDENVLRFLTVRLDKYGIEYNEKRRKGLIGKKKAAPAEENKSIPVTENQQA